MSYIFAMFPEVWCGTQKSFEQQKWPSRLLNVIGIRATWYATYDFLFVFHCNCVPILHSFRDIISYFYKSKQIAW